MLEDRYEGERVACVGVDRNQTIQRQNRPTCGIYNQCVEFSCFYHKFFFSTFLLYRFFSSWVHSVVFCSLCNSLSYGRTFFFLHVHTCRGFFSLCSQIFGIKTCAPFFLRVFDSLVFFFLTCTVWGQKKQPKVNECSSVANYRTAMIFFLQSSQYS